MEPVDDITGEFDMEPGDDISGGEVPNDFDNLMNNALSSNGITGDEFPINFDTLMNNALGANGQDLPVMISMMHHQFRGYQFLSAISPRSFANMLRTPFRTSILRGAAWVNELLQGHPERFYQQLRMDKSTFRLLCNKVLETGRFVEHQRNKVQIEECVAIFLHTIGMHQRHRMSAERFQHSPETISRHVHTVCDALCDLAPTYIRPPNFNSVPEFIANNSHLYPFFKDCVGAIDGTIIEAWTPASKRGTYRCRKGHLAQNVLAACDFNLQFTFVLSGWEGSANDARVIAHALSEPQFNFPWPSQGKYYVVDSGYSNFPGFLSPYRGERYHIPEWTGSNREPNTFRELFNRRHATVRNHIERCFGALKKRFPIMRGLMPNYFLDTQANLVLACCVIHNFVKKHSVRDECFDEVADPDYVDPEAPEGGAGTSGTNIHMDMSDEGLLEQSMLRDSIAQQLWHHRCRTF